jgi:hypothetical protein
MDYPRGSIKRIRVENFMVCPARVFALLSSNCTLFTQIVPIRNDEIHLSSAVS